jgi:hypothetical protein
MVDALAYQIANMGPKQIRQAVGNLARVAQRAKIPSDNPLATIGPKALPAVYQSGSLLRPVFSHAPWRGVRDGANLSTSGKPFAFASAGYNARAQFSADGSDIPEEWVAQNLDPEVHNARVNADRPFMRNLLAAGRYSHIRA